MCDTCQRYHSSDKLVALLRHAYARRKTRKGGKRKKKKNDVEHNEHISFPIQDWLAIKDVNIRHDWQEKGLRSWEYNIRKQMYLKVRWGTWVTAYIDDNLLIMNTIYSIHVSPAKVKRNSNRRRFCSSCWQLDKKQKGIPGGMKMQRGNQS